MRNKRILIILIILIVFLFVIGYFISNKIRENKRNYEIEEVSEYKYFVLKINEQYGVIDNAGKTVIEAVYDKVQIPNPSKDVFICYKNERAIAYASNKLQMFAEYNSVEPIELKNNLSNLPYEKSVLKCEKNGKFGLIDFSGNKILNTEYDNIEGFANTEGKVQITKNQKNGVANIKGTVLVKPEYDVVLSDDYSGYIVGVQNQGEYQYGYINNNGKLLLKAEYNEISRVPYELDGKDVYLIANKDAKSGVVKNKKNIINNEYQAIEYNETNKVFILEKDNNYGIADATGKIVIPIENTSMQIKGEYIYVQKNNIKQVYDASGNKTDIDFNKAIIATSNENYKITIESDEYSNYYGVANQANQQIIKPEYLYIEYAFGNYFIVSDQNGKLGMLDNNGNEIIELKYDLVKKLQDKNIIQTLLSDTNTTELYSPDMKKICEIADAAVEVKDNYIKVYSSTEIHYYNNEGEEISSNKVFPNHKLFLATQDGQWGYIDADGNVKVDFEYDQAKEFNDYGFAAVKKDGKWGSIDANGNVVLEPIYELDESYAIVEFISEYIKVQNGLGNEYYMKNE